MLRRFTFLFALILLGAPFLYAQNGNTVIKIFPAAPTGTCAPIMIAVDSATGDFYDCLAGSWNLVTGGGGGAPTNATYLVVTLNGSLTQERRLVAGTGIGSSDGGANGDFTLSFAASELTSNQTFADGTPVTLVWTWATTGTQPAITFSDGLLTVSSGNLEPGAGSKIIATRYEQPAGTVDGANKIFTFTRTIDNRVFRLFWNGLSQLEGDDYTITGPSEITMTLAPAAGDHFYAYY